MSNKTRLIVGIGLIVVGFVCILIGLLPMQGCVSERTVEEEEEYKLTAHEMDLVNLAYNNASVWEKWNNKSCESIRYVKKNGYSFLIASYPNGTTMGFDGKPMSVGMEKKYTLNLSENRVYEARLDEYGLSESGLVTGMYSYGVTWDENRKKEALGKAVSGKSAVITRFD